jgi:uncharacterized membrane protein
MRRLITFSAGPTFVFAGLLHFVIPRAYEAIVPDYLPLHRELVYASGVAEAAGGAALMSADAKVRRWGMWWLLVTLVAVFPANLHMALHADRYPQIPGGKVALYARLPFQLVFARWVMIGARRDA